MTLDKKERLKPASINLLLNKLTSLLYHKVP